jgi:hypothetical protein
VEPSSGWRRWLVCLGGIVRVAFGLEHRGRQMLRSDSQGYSILNMGKDAKVGQHTLNDKDHEDVNSAVDSSKCT